VPELPEVETVRRGLARELIDRRVDRVIVTGARTVRRHDAAQLVQRVQGHRIVDVRRLGKFLFLDLDTAETLVVHLRMSGQLLWTTDAETPLQKHTHARLQFGGDELRFVDPRTFGEMWVTTPDVPELAHLGPDALNEVATVEELGARFRNRAASLKTLLLNQTVIAGIGNIYSDEMLFVAGLRQDRSPESLATADVTRLHVAMKSILAAAIEARGSTLRDAQYVDLYGRPGSAATNHRVYARQGLACVRCGTSIERTKIGGRSSFFCPSCQH
jgi:formamidopyrimidine-DNA glycosylase